MPAESKPTAAVASPVNYCENGGYLVNADTPLPSDPFDYDGEGLPALGCSRLRCRECSAIVRSVPHFTTKGLISKVKPAELYEVPDLASSPHLEPRKGTRFYLCHCTMWCQSIGSNALSDGDTDPFTTPRVSWVCAGHPIAELPRKIDGVDVTPANVGELTAQSLYGITPPGAISADKWGGTWAVRLYERLAKTPWQERVVSAALACLDDPDADARARALDFFFKRKISAGAQRAVELLDGDRALFAGVPDKVARPSYKNPTLEHTLWLIAGPLVSQPGRARELARADALTPGKANYPLYFMLACGDPDWVSEHLDEIVRANPGEVKFLSDAIRYRFPERVPKKPVLERLKDLTQPAGAK